LLDLALVQTIGQGFVHQGLEQCTAA
jgi:hypothetical protein